MPDEIAPNAAPAAVTAAPAAPAAAPSTPPAESAPDLSGPLNGHTFTPTDSAELGSSLEQLSAISRGKSHENLKPAPKANTAPAADPAQPAQTKPPVDASRDAILADIADPKVREYLKRCSNDAFNHFVPLVRKLQNGELMAKEAHEAALKEREESLRKDITQARYLDHERGYELTPEYAELQSHTTNLNAESQFWAEQLVNLRAGKPGSNLQLDPKTGAVMVVPDVLDPKDPNSEPRVLRALNKADNLIGQLREKMTAIPVKHKAEYTKFNETILNIDKAAFGKVTGKDFLKAVDERLTKFPEGLRSRPEIQLLAKTMISGETFFNKWQTAEGELAKLKAAGGANTAPSAVETGGAGDGNNLRAQIDQINKISRGQHNRRF